MSGALCSAARRGDVSEVRRLVSEHLVDLHALEEDGDSALHCAIDSGNVEVVAYLCEAGGERVCNLDGRGGDTPLLRAADRGDAAIVRILCEAGARAHVQNHVLKDNTKCPYFRPPCSHVQWGWTPLHHACKNGHLDTVKLLLTYGAVVDFKDRRNESGLSIAARYERVAVATYLLSQCSIDAIYNACRYEQLGMYTAMRSLELDDHIREHYMNSSLLHPSEHAFLNSDLPPIEVLTSSEPDPLLRQASKRRISLSSRSHSNTSTSKPLIVEGGVWVNDAEVQNRYASHYVARSIWESVFGMTEQSFYKAKEYLLPIDYASDIQFLRACVYVSEKLGKAELFDNEVVYCAVEMAWRLYGRAYHLTLSALYFVLLACVTVTNYRLHDWIVSSDVTLFTLVITLMCAVLFLNALFVLNIASQIMEEYAENRLIAYLSDAQNIIEIGSHVIVFVAFAMRCTSRNETLTSASIMAVATVLLWFKALYYLRPFKSTGPLVRMIFFIFTSIQELSIILIIVIFGFSQAMYLLSYQNDSLDFASPYNGIINAFIYMMGNPLVEQAASTSDPSLAQFLLCTFMFASTILLLNLLIALMNNSYNTIKSKATAEWNRERAKIMIEQWRPWGAVVHRYSYYLVRVDDRADMIKTRAEATDSRLERVEAKVDALLAAIKGMQSLQHDAIEGMKAGLSKGIA